MKDDLTPLQRLGLNYLGFRAILGIGIMIALILLIFVFPVVGYIVNAVMPDNQAVCAAMAIGLAVCIRIFLEWRKRNK